MNIFPIHMKITPSSEATANLPAFPTINTKAFQADMQKFELVRAIWMYAIFEIYFTTLFRQLRQ